jgi:general secretion pathway protein N
VTRKGLILAGVATFFVGLVISFPARVAYQWFAPPNLKLSGISGSIWRGSATQGDADGVYLTDLRWSFRPLAMLTGQLEFATSGKPASGFLNADVGLGLGGRITLSDLTGAVSLTTLTGLFPLAGIEGEVSLQFEKLVIKDGMPVDAIGSAAVANLILRYLSPITLGDYRAEFQSGEDGIVGSVESESGLLELAGSTIKLGTSGEYEIAGRIRAKPATPVVIARQLQFLGTPDADGFREFLFPGRL